MIAALRYPLVWRLVHWTVAGAVVAQIALGWLAEAEPDRGASFALIRTHYQLGLALFGLMLMRLAWRLAYPPPRWPGEPRWRRAAAGIVHGLLYALLLTMPLSGYVIWVWMDVPMTWMGVVEVPRLFVPPADDETWRANAWYVHTYSAWLLIALIAVHVVAALWHELVLGDRLIRRRMA